MLGAVEGLPHDARLKFGLLRRFLSKTAAASAVSLPVVICAQPHHRRDRDVVFFHELLVFDAALVLIAFRHG